MCCRDKIDHMKLTVSAGLLSVSLVLFSCDSNDKPQGDSGLDVLTPSSEAETPSQGKSGAASNKASNASSRLNNSKPGEKGEIDQPTINMEQGPSLIAIENTSPPEALLKAATEDSTAATEEVNGFPGVLPSRPNISDYSPRYEGYRLALEDYRRKLEKYRQHLEQQRTTEAIGTEEYQKSMAGYFDATAAYQDGMTRYRKAVAERSQ